MQDHAALDLGAAPGIVVREFPLRKGLLRSLVQMQTGSGKTYTAVAESYRRLLSFWLSSKPIMNRLQRTAKATAGQFNVQVTSCRKLVIPLPPLAEQVRIVAQIGRRLSVVDEPKAVVITNLQRAARLRPAVLAAAFSMGCVVEA